ncbi:MAG: RCC1 domain-containing protein [Kofleriaceae bacterium]
MKPMWKPMIQAVMFGGALAAAACGDSTVDNVDVVAASIDFGQTDCGTTAIPRVLVVTNNTSRSFNFTTALAKGADSHYVIVPPAGTVLPHSQLSVTVFSKSIPQTSAVTENLYGETVTVTTDKSGDTPHEVQITQTARGAVLEVSASAVSFGTLQPFGMTAMSPLTINNVGNAPAMVTVTGSFFSFGFAPAGPQAVPAGGSLAGNVTFTPAHNQSDTQSLTVGTIGPMCGTPPTVTASGTGTAQGLAAQAVPASWRKKPSRTGGSTNLCVRTTTGVVACSGLNINGMRGASDEYLLTIPELQGKKGKGEGGGGLAIVEIVNVVQTELGFLTDVVELVSGTGFYCARRQAGDVWCWGDYTTLARPDSSSEAVQLLRTNPHAEQIIPSGATAIAAGYWFRCAVTGATNDLECKTRRAGTSADVRTEGWTAAGVTAAAIHGAGGYALLADQTVLSFGTSARGARGNGSSTSDPPSAVTGLTGITQVVAGGRTAQNEVRNFGCARKDDGTVWCWGNNRHGNLGNGTTSDSSTPVQVIDSTDTPLAGVTALTAGIAHTCALIGGGVSCWGRGNEGQMGSGTTGEFSKAVATNPALTNVTSIEAAGTRTTCATQSDGAVRCWGEFSGIEYVTPEPVLAFEP